MARNCIRLQSLQNWITLWSLIPLFSIMKKGVAPKVSAMGRVQSAMRERLIVVAAITKHGPLGHEHLTAL